MGFRGILSGRRSLSGLALLVCLAAAGPAHAQSVEERAGARAAAGEGNKALREGRWADAIDLFTRAESLVHAPPHLLYMARAQVEVGMLVEARENLMRVSREALAPDAPRAFKMAQEEAQAEIKAVEARIPYVTVTVRGGGASDVGVTQDGNRVPGALIGVPRPVNPGQHVFEAVSGSLKATATIQIKEAERQRVILDLKAGSGSSAAGGAAPPPPAGGKPTEEAKAKKPPAKESPKPEASSGPPEAQAKDTGTKEPEPEQGGGMNGMRLGSYIAGGVGVLGLAGGVIFSLGAKSKYDDSDALYKKYACDTALDPGTACTPDIQSKIKSMDSSAGSQKTLGLVGFIVGGLGIAGGVTLFVLSGDDKGEKSARGTPVVRVAGAPGFVALTGSF